jgi:hypothetical protein
VNILQNACRYFIVEIEKVVIAIDAKALKSSNQKPKGIKSLIELRP